MTKQQNANPLSIVENALWAMNSLVSQVEITDPIIKEEYDQLFKIAIANVERAIEESHKAI